MGVRRSRVTGLGANGLASESVSIDQRGNATTNRVWRNRAAAEEVSWVKYPTSTTPAVTTSTNGLVRSSTSQTGVTTTFAYDAFKREVSQTDGRGTTTRTVYDNLGRVASTIDALGYATIYGYDALGRQVSVTDPLTNTVTTAYDAEGRVIAQRGATYPVDYSYDEFGDKVSMTPYRNISAIGDVTRWLRDEATGLVTNKVYADGKGPRYTYTPDGRLATRTWARGVVTAYAYDSSGALTNTVYSDGTPTVSMAYDPEGHVVSQRGATYPVDYAYDEFGNKISMTTYRDLVGRGDPTAPQGDVTRWLRDEATGLVTNKVYADGKGPRYDYTPDGKLATRTWARGIVTTYSYDANGALTNTVYSDGTPTVSLAYSRAGRQIEAHDAAGITTFLYDDFGSLTNETVIGVAGTNTIERFYDTFGRDAGYALNGVRQSTLAYDHATGRLATMLANGCDTPFTWNYLAGSDLKSSLA